MHKKAWLALLTCLLLSGIPPAIADIHNVDPGESIQAAINAASDGDEVVVALGTYNQVIDFVAKAITVRSTNPTDPAVVAATILDGTGWNSSVVRFLRWETARSILEGFTITGGTGWSGPTSVTLGGGVCCWDSSATVRNNIIRGNTAYGGGGIQSCGGRATIQNNVITGNQAEFGGGIACSVSEYARVTIQSNTISNNRATYGGGIYCGRYSPIILYNRIAGNHAVSEGGGVCFSGSAPSLRNNTIVRNDAEAKGGGIACKGRAAPVIRSNTLEGNSAPSGGGLYCETWSSPTIVSCIVAFSTAGGGLAADATATPKVTFSDFFGNAGGNFVGLPQSPAGKNGNIAADPLFADAANGDLRLKSKSGRWDPKQGKWVADTVHSPCIDAGDPVSYYYQEPTPNGARINMGAEGNAPEASKSLPPRPDLMIRQQGETKWVGAAVYNTTGKGQTRSATVARGKKAVFYLRARNNSKADDTLTLEGASGASGKWQVAYFDSKGKSITAAIVAGEWASASVKPKGAVDFRVELTPLTGAPLGKAFAVQVEVKSASDRSVRDVAKAVTTPKASRGPAAQLTSLTAVPTRGGAQITFSLFSPAEVEARVLNLAGRPIRTLCRDQACDARSNTILWDACSEDGLPVPSGRYLIEVAARAADGASSRALRTLLLQR